MRKPRKPRKPRNRKPRNTFYAYSYTNFIFDSSLAELAELSKHSIYAVVGLEVCPTTSRYHTQGYFYLRRPLSTGKARRILVTAHIEPARECPATNFLYCTKCRHYDSFGSITQACKLWRSDQEFKSTPLLSH